MTVAVTMQSFSINSEIFLKHVSLLCSFMFLFSAAPKRRSADIQSDISAISLDPTHSLMSDSLAGLGNTVSPF